MPLESIEGFDRPDPALIGLMRQLSEGYEADLLNISGNDEIALRKKAEI